MLSVDFLSLLLTRSLNPFSAEGAIVLSVPKVSIYLYFHKLYTAIYTHILHIDVYICNYVYICGEYHIIAIYVSSKTNRRCPSPNRPLRVMTPNRPLHAQLLDAQVGSASDQETVSATVAALKQLGTRRSMIQSRIIIKRRY